MFGIGMNEMMIILVIAVIIIGPRQIPQMARSLGKMAAQFKRATNELRTAVNEEIAQQIETEELKEIRNSLEGDLEQIGSQARSIVDNELEEDRKTVEVIQGNVTDAASVVRERMVGAVEEAEQELAQAESYTKSVKTGKGSGKPKTPAKTQANKKSVAKAPSKTTGTSKAKKTPATKNIAKTAKPAKPKV